MNNLKSLENRIGYQFKDLNKLRKAMTHTSYANEKKLGRTGSNERLEFLGDAVLEVVTSEFLFEQYPDMPEGEMTKKRASMVCEMSLAFSAREFDLPEFILLGKGEEGTGGRKRDSIISDATEALIGAIYLDGGFDAARRFIREFILNDIEHKKLFYDSKTVLQEIVQEDNCKEIEYHLIREDGPDHDKNFLVEVLIKGISMGEGAGHTKKAAEQAAAYQAIRRIKGVS